MGRWLSDRVGISGDLVCLGFIIGLICLCRFGFKESLEADVEVFGLLDF